MMRKRSGGQTSMCGRRSVTETRRTGRRKTYRKKKEDVSEHITHIVSTETFHTWTMGIKTMREPAAVSLN